MDTHTFGIPTLHTRVESWECDYNGHWNTRFYGRGFQLAAETLAPQSGGAASAAVRPVVRHIRFHRELHVASNVEIRSGRLRCPGRLDGAIVHVLSGERGLSATALDLPGIEADVPEVSVEDVPLALPRGIGEAEFAGWPEQGAESSIVELGIVYPNQVDCTGSLLFDELMRCAGVLSSRQMQQLGQTPAQTEKTRISRMAVEARVTRHCRVTAGTRLQGQSRIAGVSNKRIRTDHRILAQDDSTVATLEFCLVTVNVDTRRSVPVPEEIVVASRAHAATE